jgi:hypothetical protein
MGEELGREHLGFVAAAGPPLLRGADIEMSFNRMR